MSRRPRGRVGIAGVASLLVGLIGACAALGEARYTDPTGDPTGGAPDIAQVIVSNSGKGALRFRITTVAPVGADVDVYLFLNTDARKVTGFQGADYLLLAGVAGSDVERWNGSDFVATGAALPTRRSGNVFELRVARKSVGRPTRIGFSAAMVRYDAAGTSLGEDNAPDKGTFTYVLTLPRCANGKDDDRDGNIDARDLGCSSPTDTRESGDPVTLRAARPAVVPAVARAGRSVVVAVRVTRLETGRSISSGVVRCAARVGSKALRGRGRIVSGKAACRFAVPLRAKGMTVRGKIGVTYLGTTKSVPFRFRAN